MKHKHKFSGYAELTDYDSDWWQRSFKILDGDQDVFLKTNPHPEAYPWPKDALHNYIRSWEYPYVYQNIIDHSNDVMKILDVGSGITFFPFALSKHSHNVYALDNNKIIKKGYLKANQKMPKSFKSVSAIVGSANKMPLDENAFDVVYCISVLEHASDRSSIIKEMYRVLKKDGLCILTFDVNLIDNEVGLSIEEFQELIISVQKIFKLKYPVRLTHPMNHISTTQSRYPLNQPSPLILMLKNLKLSIMNKDIKTNYDITSMGLILEK